MNDWIEHKFEDCLCEPEIIFLDPETGVPWPGGGTEIIHKAIDGREN